MARWLTLLAGLLLVTALAGACRGGGQAIILATTTSVYDTGLMDAIVPAFEEATGLRLKVVPVGSGQALRLGREGQADVLLVHSPEAEARFMAEGYGRERRLVMVNYFVVVGPADDPAGVRGAASAQEAFQRIARSGAPFYSRADGSGTHERERAIWARLGLDPTGQPWYHEVGAGQAQTLLAASEQRGYALTDKGTYLGLSRRLALTVLVEGDPFLRNEYHVITVDPARSPHVNAAGAAALADFLVSPQGQRIIGSFGVREFGEPLFQPVALAAGR